jgi:hypothetical protein
MEIQVNIQGAVSAVIEHWESLSASDIGELAKTIWYGTHDDTRQTELLCALQLAKGLDTATSWDSLVALWEQMLLGFCMGERKGLERPTTVPSAGGLANAEGRRNFSKVKKFIEAAFLPKILLRLDEKFDEAARRVSKCPTNDERVSGYKEIGLDLDSWIDKFGEFTRSSVSKLEKWVARKEGLLDQLIDAE